MTRRQIGTLTLIGALVAVVGWALWPRARSAGIEETAREPRERALREAIRRDPRDPEAARALALHLLRSRRPYEAMWAFQDLLALRPGDADARRGLARALIVAQLPGRALEVLAEGNTATRPATHDGSEALEDRRVAAAAYLARGDALGAVTMLEAMGPVLDGSSAALLDLANAYEALGEETAAAKTYERQLRQDPESVEGQIGLGRVSARRRDWPVALSSLARARQLSPGDPRPLYHLAHTMQARLDAGTEARLPGEPIAIYRELARSHPSYGPAHLELGRWHLREGRATEAIPYLEHAVQDKRVGEDARRDLAAALDAAGRKADATAQRGLYYERTERPHLAVREYQRLAALDPSREENALLLSAAYSQMEKDETAAEVARRGLEQHPDDLRLRTRRAMLLLMTDDRAAAAALCERWIRERPAWAEPYRLLARNAREAMHHAEAVRYMEQALQREPRNHEYHLEMARSLIAIATPESFRRAVETLRQGLALLPDEPEMHLRLAEALERLGDMDGARLHYLRSMDGARTVHFGAYSLSQLCPRLKRPERARFYAENVRVIRERSDATQALSRQLHRDPDSPELRARLADLLLQSGDTHTARSHLEVAVGRRPDAERQRQLAILQRMQSMQ